MLAALSSIDPFAAAFISLGAGLVLAYQRGWIVSAAEHKRVVADLERAYAKASKTEERITGYHEKRAEIAEARADRADAALVESNAKLPAALHALAQSKAAAS